MLRYIIRLDDATPKMNAERWMKMEILLDQYGIHPMVGVIPESHDSLFVWEEDPEFWTGCVQRWKDKNWTIAQHGLHHVYHDCGGGGVHSEYIGLPYSEQMELIRRGYKILNQHNCKPSCFFAPGHTFDKTTVDVCRDSGYFDFISDGYALYPYEENGMLFFPSVFDTPHKILPYGIYTFVYHPSFMTDESFNGLEEFIKSNRKYFVSIDQILGEINMHRRRNFIEQLIEPAIMMIRKIRRSIKNIKR